MNKISTDSTITIANGAESNLIHTDSSGTSGKLVLNNLSGQTVYIEDDGGTQYKFSTGVSGVDTTFIDEGAGLSYKYAIVKHGEKSLGASFVTTSETSVIYAAIPDTVYETDRATILAYTELETLDKFFDRISVYETEAAGVKYGRLGVKEGDNINIGAYNIVVNDNGAAFTFDGTTITINGSVLFGTGANIKGITTTGTVTITTPISTGLNFRESSAVNIVDDSVAITLTNASLLINTVSNWTLNDFSFNNSNIVVADNTGAVEIYTGGAVIPVVEGLNNTVTYSDDVPVVITHNAEVTCWQDLSKFNNYLTEYADAATAQAANPTPNVADYYRTADDGNFDYWDGAQWVEDVPDAHSEYNLPAIFGGTNRTSPQTVLVPANTTIRFCGDSFGKYMSIIEVNSGAVGTTATLICPDNTAPDASRIVDALPFVVQSSITPPDNSGLMDIFIPDLGDDRARALCVAELLRLSEGSLSGALATNDAALLEIYDDGVKIKNDTVRFFPLNGYSAGSKCQVPVFLELINYTIEPNPIDANGNYTAFEQVQKTVVKTGILEGNIPALDALQYIEQKVYIDENVVESGVGSFSDPCKTIVDAKNVSAESGIYKFTLLSPLTLDDDIDNIVIEGVGRNILNLNGRSINGASIYNVDIVGTSTGNVYVERCKIGTATLHGEIYNTCFRLGTFTLNGDTVLEHCFSHVAGANAPTINKGSHNLAVRVHGGGVILDNVTGGETSMEFNVGNLTLNSSCTGGTVYARGATVVTNNSNGTIVDTSAQTANLSIADNFENTANELQTSVDASLRKYKSATKGDVFIANL